MKNVICCLFILFGTACQDKENSPSPDPSLVYFLVTEISPEHGDSFILPLKDANHIAAAREIISSGESKIIVAEISTNKNDAYSLNKDLKNNRKWSWHISNFLEFADMTIEIYDGWPGYVEENYAEWVSVTKGENGKGRIGFWNYTVSREVSREELYAK